MLDLGTILSGHPTHVHKLLVLIHKRAIWIIAGAEYLEDYRPLLIQSKVMTVFNLYILYCPVAVKSKEGLLMIHSNVHEHEMRQALSTNP